MKIWILTASIIGALSVNAFAQDSLTDRAADKLTSYLEPLRYVERLSEPAKEFLAENNLDLNFFMGMLQGYDSNVNLDSAKKEAFFSETSLNTEVAYNYTDDIRLKLENDTSYVFYYDYTDSTLLDLYNKVGLETDILDDMFTVGTSYALDYVLFPMDEEGTYLAHEVGTFLKYNASNSIYHKLEYRFLHKTASHYKTLSAGNVRTGDLRKDYRNSLEYELGIYVSDKLLFKGNAEFYINESNYEYFHYYDYCSIKLRPSLIYMITEKLYASGSVSFRQRQYDDRLSSENDEHVYDDTYGVNGSLFYDLTDSFTIAVNVSYRENDSNEPLQEYTGSTVTGGVYYSF